MQKFFSQTDLDRIAPKPGLTTGQKFLLAFTVACWGAVAYLIFK